MLKGVYGIATAQETAALQHAVVARNLAHTQVPGFRRLLTSVGAFEQQQPQATQEGPSADRGGLQTQIDFSPGAFTQTGRPLDVAILGQGFFVVQEAASNPANQQPQQFLTRRGNFLLNGDGLLVTPDNRPVLGRSGPVRITPAPEQTHLRIDQQGRVLLDDDTGNTVEIDQLRIVTVPDESQLQAQGTTLFVDPTGTATPLATPQLATQTIESSNVQPVEELVRLIAIQRNSEAATRSLQAIMRTLQQRINLE